jgi:hypothetical protein
VVDEGAVLVEVVDPEAFSILSTPLSVTRLDRLVLLVDLVVLFGASPRHGTRELAVRVGGGLRARR